MHPSHNGSTQTKGIQASQARHQQKLEYTRLHWKVLQKNTAGFRAAKTNESAHRFISHSVSRASMMVHPNRPRSSNRVFETGLSVSEPQACVRYPLDLRCNTGWFDAVGIAGGHHNRAGTYSPGVHEDLSDPPPAMCDTVRTCVPATGGSACCH